MTQGQGPRVSVVLSIGSNLGDRGAALRRAVDQLSLGGVNLRAVSGVYETEPIGGPEQPRYLNAVAVGETDASPQGVLALAQSIEADLGRVRDVRWGPRTLDIDVIAYGSAVSDDPVLTLPHPRAAERAFVLVPWLDADPQAVLPDGRRVADVCAGLSEVDRRGVRRTALALTSGATS